MSKIYLVAGQIGSGKTTFSKELESRTGAFRFSPDEWMLKLCPGEIRNEEFDHYFFICCEIAWKLTKKLSEKGLDIILDFGFWNRELRDKYIQRIIGIGAEYKLYYVYCPEETIRERIKARNESLPNDCFRISDEAFNFFSPGFQPPSEDERFELIDNS
ncbi:MAG TPA: hypothetical protein DD381_00350 [Lentisphaeria bacterium]|nr:MAG: hypothetical protein A2X47_06075 [Lentisphaerae bacterium GWF2_38_69]HBM14792.1 hypothetical protein [Lentisphaeria bacterium]